MAKQYRTVDHYLKWAHLGRHSIILHLLTVLVGYAILMYGFIVMLPVLQRFDFLTYYSQVRAHLDLIGSVLLMLLVVWLVLGRPGYSIISPSRKIYFKLFLLGTTVTVLTNLLNVFDFIPLHKVHYNGFDAAWAAGWPIILLSAVGILIQTGFEEMYFRGIVMQATYRLTAYLVPVLFVQAIYFALLHIGNVSQWGTNLPVAIPYLLMALSFAYAAWRTGSLYLSWGLHFGNNLFLLMLVHPSGDVGNDVTPFTMEQPSLEHTILYNILVLVVVVLTTEFTLPKERRFKGIWKLPFYDTNANDMV